MDMILTSPFLMGYCLVISLLLGAVFGSFLTCAGGRYVAGESFLMEKSHCDSCGHILSGADLVPIFSFLLRRGRCRYCGVRISSRSTWAELGLAGLFALFFLRFGLSAACLQAMAAGAILLALSLIDLDSMEIPNGLLLALIGVFLVGLPFAGHLGGIRSGLLGAFGIALPLLLLTLLLERVLQKEALGGGDLKLFFVTGLFLGPAANFLTLLLSCVLGLLFAALSRKGKDEPFPFGPAIAAAFVVVLLAGEKILGWYFGLFY